MRVPIVLTEGNAVSFMRRAGYGFQKEAGGEVAFVRRVGGGMFPRYHAYVQETTSDADSMKRLVVNLHIDQKAPTYGSHSVHSGEYGGALIDKEAARLHALAQTRTEERRTGEREAGETKKGFWGKLFG